MNIPKWVEKKLEQFSQTAIDRYLRVMSILDAWKKANTSANICSAWEKTGLLPLDVERVLESKYIRETQESDTNSMNSSKCKIEINGLEITSFAKRLEISRLCSNM